MTNIDATTEILSRAIFIFPLGGDSEIRICCNWCSYFAFEGDSHLHPNDDWLKKMIEHFVEIHPNLLTKGDPERVT